MKKEEKRKVVSWECLYESKNRSLEKLFEIYRESKYDARVIFKQSKGNYDNIRVVLFEYDNGDFKIEVDKEHYQKKMKLLAPGIDPKDPINFDITKSVAGMVRSGGKTSGREDNETGFVGGLDDINL